MLSSAYLAFQYAMLKRFSNGFTISYIAVWWLLQKYRHTRASGEMPREGNFHVTYQSEEQTEARYHFTEARWSETKVWKLRMISRL